MKPTIVRDPGVEVGEYRILLRTDHTYAIHDDRIKGPIKLVSVHDTLAAAKTEAERLVRNERKVGA